MTGDDRMTWGLIGEILDALERHGYHQYDNRHTAQAVGAIVDLAGVYDGTRDPSNETYLHQATPARHAGPGPSAPEADDAVILTDDEASTVAAALDVAAGYNRGRAAACADCADQTCLTCQSRLQDAQAYDDMAAQMLQTAEVSRIASSYQPEPSIPPDPSVQSYLVADKEAGQ